MSISFNAIVDARMLAQRLSSEPEMVLDILADWADPNEFDPDAMIAKLVEAYPASIASSRIAAYLREIADALDEVELQEGGER